MRVNVYAEEMTDKVEIITKNINGNAFTGVRFHLYLPVTGVNGEQHKGPFIHGPDDDDSSAVTFWGKRDLREVLKTALRKLDEHYMPSLTKEEDRSMSGTECRTPEAPCSNEERFDPAP